MDPRVNKFGNPGAANAPDADWFAAHVVRVKLPWVAVYAVNGKPITTARFHREGADQLLAALRAVWSKAEELVQAGPAWATERLRLKKLHGYDLPSAFYDAQMADFLQAQTRALLHSFGGDVWGGTYEHRPQRGGDRLSSHAFAIAVDIDPAHNPMGLPKRTTLPLWYVACFEQHGFVWGGKWARPDTMHFELAL